MAAAALKVYWRPGCSSCVRVKEFLSGLGVDYESVNVSAQPEAMDELRALGVRTVPVVARGGEYVFAQELADVSRFLGKEVSFQILTRGKRAFTSVPADRQGYRRSAVFQRSFLLQRTTNRIGGASYRLLQR